MQLSIVFLVPLLGMFLGSESPSGLSEVKMKLERGDCPPFWFSFNGRCYKYVATDLTWADAELYCVSQRANLVSIHSLEENNFVRSLILNFDHNQGRTWIGLSDIHKEGSWMWSDGLPVDFLHWASRQPDNWQSSEHCVVLGERFGDNWNDCNCGNMFPSVCASP